MRNRSPACGAAENDEGPPTEVCGPSLIRNDVFSESVVGEAGLVAEQIPDGVGEREQGGSGEGIFNHGWTQMDTDGREMKKGDLSESYACPSVSIRG